MTRFITHGLLAAVLLFGFAALASAQPLLIFDQTSNNEGGSINFDPSSSNPASGNGINFDHVSGKHTAKHDGDRLPATGELDFKLGNLEGITNNGDTTTANFGSGGSFTLTGSFKGSGDQELLHGTWNHAQVTYDNTENQLDLSGTGSNSADTDILDYFGIDPNSDLVFDSTNISANNPQFDPETGAFSGDVDQADITDKAISAVPEPAPLGLFGLGLVLLGVTLRYKQRSNS
jgi:hypothetical protein